MSSTSAKFLIRDQVFRIALSGLMPLTIHYAYKDLELIASSNIKPVGGALGDPIKTNINGQVSFDYYFNGGLLRDTTPWAEAQKYESMLATPKAIVVSNRSSASLDPLWSTTHLSVASTTITVDVLTNNTYKPTAAVYNYIEVPGPVITVEHTSYLYDYISSI